MNWDDLRYFKVLAQTLNLADAANELASSEATVLRRVACSRPTRGRSNQ